MLGLQPIVQVQMLVYLLTVQLLESRDQVILKTQLGQVHLQYQFRLQEQVGHPVDLDLVALSIHYYPIWMFLIYLVV